MHPLVKIPVAIAFASLTYLVAGIAYQEVANTNDKLMDHFIPRALAADGSGLGQYYNFPPDVIGTACPVPDVYNGKDVQPTATLVAQNAMIAADARGRVATAYCKGDVVTLAIDWQNGDTILIGSMVKQEDVLVRN